MWSALPAIDLNDLIVPGPVERGLYVVPGTGELVPHIMEKLVELLGMESSEPTMVPRHTSKLSYSQNRYWRRNSRIGQLIWVDSGNTFDPYRISIEAKRRGLDPIRILRAMKVGRPFTAFQYQQMLERIPNPALWAPTSTPAMSATERSIPRNQSLADVSQAMWWTPMVIISDLMGLFYDPDLPPDALIRAFRSFMMRLSFLRQRAIVLAFLRDEIPPTNRQHLLPEVIKLARRVYVQDHFAVPEPRLLAKAG